MSDSNLKTIGKYQILDQIGASAAGTTYRARDPFRNRELAIKVIRDVTPLSAELKDKLYTALTGYSELAHRHIRKIHDLGEVDGQVYIASEMLAGVDLAGSLDGQPAPIAQKLSLFAQVSEALAFAHGKGVAHGNLKPGNIFVDGSDATVLDFGIGTWQECMLAAKARPEGLLPNYLSPEQILGESFDARSDLFSLGLILYEALTGRYPFQVPAGLIPRELVHAEPELLRKADPQMPEELEQLLVSALKKKPQERLQTADEFAATLYKIARRLRREQVAPTALEAPPTPVPQQAVTPERERFSPLENSRAEVTAAENSRAESMRAQNNRADARPEEYTVPVAQDTALQPWSARSFSAQAQVREMSPAPAPREESVKAPPPVPPAPPQHSDATVILPAMAIPPAAARPAPAMPPQTPLAALPPQAPPAGARMDAKPGPMPRRFQRTAPPRSSRKLPIRILTVAAGALIAAWLVGSLLSRQSLHANQTKSRIETAAPKTPVREADPQPAAEPVAAPDQAAKKAADAPKKELSAETILRLRVKPLWEAGKYAQAMQEVNQALAAEPSNEEARTWKKKIQAAQDAEAAIK